MKKTVSVKELKEYCESHHLNNVVFKSSDQEWYNVLNPCKINMSFPGILVWENPSMVCLKADKNMMMFDQVRYAEINTDLKLLGTLFKLFCGNAERRGKYTTYTLFAE